VLPVSRQRKTLGGRIWRPAGHTDSFYRVHGRYLKCFLRVPHSKLEFQFGIGLSFIIIILIDKKQGGLARNFEKNLKFFSRHRIMINHFKSKSIKGVDSIDVYDL